MLVTVLLCLFYRYRIFVNAADEKILYSDNEIVE